MNPSYKRPVVLAVVALAVLVVLLANVHLVYVSLSSQPECVPHVRLGEKMSQSVAAKSSCRAD